MLVLTRRPGESIVINGNVVVTILPSQGHQVKIGIDAPASVSVDRAEIAARKAAGLPAPQKGVRA